MTETETERTEREEGVTLSGAKGAMPGHVPFTSLRVTRCAFRSLSVSVLSALSVLSPLSAQSLPKRLDARLDTPAFERHLWGVALVDEQGKLLYGRNAHRLFIPASNAKIVVAAVASALLPPDWTVRTSLYADGPVSGGVLEGDLVLYGRGDPTFGKRCYDTDTLR